MDGMDAESAAQAFAELFPALYRRFCRTTKPRQYRPSPASLAIMLHLADAGPLTVTEAARHMHRSQAAMSELLRRLVVRGLLARLPDERDRRRHLIWLTPAGEALLAEVRRVLSDQRLLAAFRQMSARARRDLIAGARALLATRPKSGEQP